ncbi:MAG: class I SAM-dependent methyltransferase [Aureispira sp.]|nr:class I SAM-dependent methyltransferase [Aureispira sp.]
MNINIPTFRFNNPMSAAKLNEMIDLLDLNAAHNIIDFGGGNGEVLLEMISRKGSQGTLVDLDNKLLEACAQKSQDLITQGKLKIVHKDAKVYLKELSLGSFDCIVCIGSSHAFGSYLDLVKTIKPYLKPNAVLLVGEGFWQQAPAPEYLEALGGQETDLMYHYQNIEKAEELGMQYLYSTIASEDDWNRWEGAYFLKKELELNSLDQEKAYLQQQLFRKAQIQYGRKTMGFGLYLFANK